MRRKRPPQRDPHEMGMSEELMLLTGMKEWRQQHPRATLREIEEAMDERLAKLRAGMLEELVKMSPQADWSQGPEEQRPRCERCGELLESRGKRRRWLQTSGGKPRPTRPQLWDLPPVWAGSFSPSMRNWG